MDVSTLFKASVKTISLRNKALGIIDNTQNIKKAKK